MMHQTTKWFDKKEKNIFHALFHTWASLINSAAFLTILEWFKTLFFIFASNIKDFPSLDYPISGDCFTIIVIRALKTYCGHGLKACRNWCGLLACPSNIHLFGGEFISNGYLFY